MPKRLKIVGKAEEKIAQPHIRFKLSRVEIFNKKEVQREGETKRTNR
jgi:hypothetical protein